MSSVKKSKWGSACMLPSVLWCGVTCSPSMTSSSPPPSGGKCRIPKSRQTSEKTHWHIQLFSIHKRRPIVYIQVMCCKDLGHFPYQNAQMKSMSLTYGTIAHILIYTMWHIKFTCIEPLMCHPEHSGWAIFAMQVNGWKIKIQSLYWPMTVQCKDVDNYITCLRYAFSMGSFPWKVSHILKLRHCSCCSLITLKLQHIQYTSD